MHRSYKSDLAAAIHDTCETLHEHGLLDPETMKEFDATCLVDKHRFTPEKICALRKKAEVSRSVFARHLGVTKEDVEAWENGTAVPILPVIRLLALVERDGFDVLKL